MAMVSIHYANPSETIIALLTAVDIKVQLYTLSHNRVLRNSVYLLCMLTLMTLDPWLFYGEEYQYGPVLRHVGGD